MFCLLRTLMRNIHTYTYIYTNLYSAKKSWERIWGARWQTTSNDCDRDRSLWGVYVTIGCPSVRPSVCSSVSLRLSVCGVDRQQQRRAAGLLQSAGAGSRYRSIATGAAYRLSIDCRRRRSAANAGSVMLRAEDRGSTQTCYLTTAATYTSCIMHAVYRVIKTGESKFTL